jgi:hypothetical protein
VVFDFGIRTTAAEHIFFEISSFCYPNVAMKLAVRNPKTPYGDIILDVLLHIGAPLRRRFNHAGIRKESAWDNYLLI